MTPELMARKTGKNATQALNEAKKAFLTEFKAKLIDIKSGKYICLMQEADAKNLALMPLDRIEVKNPKNGKKIVSLVDLTDSILKEKELGIFADVKEKLNAMEGQMLEVMPVERPQSLKLIKKKLKGQVLEKKELEQIVSDISENKLSEIETAAFVSAVYVHGLNLEETVYMTKALIKSGNQLKLTGTIVDKHSIGGLNGRVTMLVVPIIACTGLKIPKTSSRSITSAAGTADSMDVLANVSLSRKQIKQITDKVGGVIAWGGAVDLAPADDKIIKVEHPLSLDPEGQVIASVMAKKASVGAKYVVIDLPVGKETKVKTIEAAESMAKKFVEVGKQLGMKVEAIITNGEEPSGPAFGPALEARHVLRILEGKIYDNMAQKSVEISGALLELSGKEKKGAGNNRALKILESGQALKKMKEIIKAQGGKIYSSEEIPDAEFSYEVKSTRTGQLTQLDVWYLAQTARLAGAPNDMHAGVLLNVEEGEKVKKGDLMFTIYSNNRRKLNAAVKYAESNRIIEMEKVVWKKIT
ncbi:MAG: AMP phosphorylase [Candidatus Diapherotrites archaeon]